MSRRSRSKGNAADHIVSLEAQHRTCVTQIGCVNAVAGTPAAVPAGIFRLIALLRRSVRCYCCVPRYCTWTYVPNRAL